MIIKVLGPGCNNCKNLERVTRQAIDDLGIDATIDKVTDYPTIARYGVLSTPALVIDEKLVLSGRVPTVSHVRDILSAASWIGERNGAGRAIRPELPYPTQLVPGEPLSLAWGRPGTRAPRPPADRVRFHASPDAGGASLPCRTDR